MPIEFWKAKTGWFWTARSPNGRVISDSAEIYSSRAKAILGAKATAREFEAWQDENRQKSLKGQTSVRSKPADKPFTLLSNPTRKTVKRGG
jgi:hypothetical protein